MRLDEVPSSLGLSDSILPRSLQEKIGLSRGSQESSSCQVLAGHMFPAASSPQSTCNWPAQSSDHHGCLLTAPAFSAPRRVGVLLIEFSNEKTDSQRSREVSKVTKPSGVSLRYKLRQMHC